MFWATSDINVVLATLFLFTELVNFWMHYIPILHRGLVPSLAVEMMGNFLNVHLRLFQLYLQAGVRACQGWLFLPINLPVSIFINEIPTFSYAMDDLSIKIIIFFIM